MLNDMKNDCIRYAKLLGDYQSIDVDSLANGYCLATDTGDDTKRSEYLSALILRFWYTIDKMYKKSQGIGLDREDFYGWLADAIDYACKYRAWQDPTKSINAQQAINKCIDTIRLQRYYEFNLDKHRSNYNTVSLETPLGDGAGNDEEKTLGDTLLAADMPTVDNSGVESVIQSYINDKKIVQAIILDTIAFNDVQKHTKIIIRDVDEDGKPTKRTVYHDEFWPYKLVQTVSTLPEDYDKYFSKKYSIAASELSAALDAVRKANNQKLYRYLEKTLSDAKSNKRVLEMAC